MRFWICALSLCVAIGCYGQPYTRVEHVTWGGETESKSPSESAKWEYKFITTYARKAGFTPEEFLKRLNAFAAEGWEYVDVLVEYYVLLRRRR